MRVAPCGLFAKTPQEARDLGCKTAGLTHQHPAGWDTAGIFAEIIWWLVQGAQLKDTIHQIYQVQKDDWHSDTREALGYALYLADLPECSAETVESLGGGWVAEEALAISIYCALKAQGFEHGVLLAVNHSGDSDSTGAITGNLLGAVWGVNSIPQTWRDRIELPQVLTFIGHLLTQRD
jgi:ADP-ribosylglycohydrolase